MNTLRSIAIALLLLTLPAMLRAEDSEPALTPAGEEILWRSPEKGLDMAKLAYSENKEGEFSRRLVIRVLRFDTEQYDFCLFSSRWEGQSVPTMREWAASKTLTAAINASMYLKDGQTSTGYMRSGERTNNGRIVSRYGAFFVAGPRESGLPRAAVLDRSVDDWQNLLPKYDIVVQNFRLMGPDGLQIWPERGPEHAIAAIAEDMNGRILFLHCSDPASVHDFVEALNAHKDLNLNSAMYVEGGSEASLLLSLPGEFHLWNGMSPASYMFSSRGDAIPLPNVLGVVRRQESRR
ncbi:phosphodiester glycosidase family protein [Mailhella sp.]|uniref:phosphodiester glycosidase family protein n=1 Tax=Mailhella sp. TaxID=1981029 RepID=UPI003AB6C776